VAITVHSLGPFGYQSILMTVKEATHPGFPYWFSSYF
jgi:hypothetical protein